MVLGDGFDDVLSAAREGDEHALAELYRDLAPLVLGYLRGRGARDAEDVTSETFVAVVRNLGRFRGDEVQLRSWVLTIAHRRLIDERRRAGRRPEMAVDPEDLVHAAGKAAGNSSDDAEILALDRLATRDTLAFLDVLTEDQRAVVLLRLVADLPVEQVARVLGKRPGAVKTLQRRALARLARTLEETREPGDPSGAAVPDPFPEEDVRR